MAHSQKSVMKNRFAQVPSATIPRSSFDRSHGYKSTFDADLLIPIIVDEVLPGDTINLKLTALARLATPIKPIMDNMFMETFFFFVPNRLLWDNWEKFNGEQENPADSTDFVIPIISTNGYLENTIQDYMGIPTTGSTTGAFTHSALPLRAYNLIWNEWFRDENLQDSAVVDTADGPEPGSNYVLKQRGKRHDYFTSCLPFPQKGDSVIVPLGTTAPVVPDITGPGFGTPLWGTTDSFGIQTVSAAKTWETTANITTGFGPEPWLVTGLETDLTAATAVTINTLRESFQIQKLLERDARGGSRYTEIIRAHFGVTSPDARLQRPEYLGGGSSPINISAVPQTGFTATDVQTSETPQGNLAAFGTATLNNHGFTKSFTEHGYLIGLVNVRADLTYQTGLHKLWSRSTRFDFYWPAFQGLGEQAVLNQEIFLEGALPIDEEVFGYQERFAEYRYFPSQITSLFRSSASASLDVWHLSQDFIQLPILGDNFISSSTPIDRVVAVPSEPDFIFDGYFQINQARPMPVYGVPGLIDHF